MHRVGEVENVRLRSVTVHPDSKKPRKAAIKSGDVMPGHSLHAYVVFQKAASSAAAMHYNMQLVSTLCSNHTTVCLPIRLAQLILRSAAFAFVAPSHAQQGIRMHLLPLHHGSRKLSVR